MIPMNKKQRKIYATLTKSDKTKFCKELEKLEAIHKIGTQSNAEYYSLYESIQLEYKDRFDSAQDNYYAEKKIIEDQIQELRIQIQNLYTIYQDNRDGVNQLIQKDERLVAPRKENEILWAAVKKQTEKELERIYSKFAPQTEKVEA